MDLTFHIAEFVVSILGLFLATKGYFPERSEKDIAVLKNDVVWHKAYLDRIEKKLDKILLEDYRE